MNLENLQRIWDEQNERSLYAIDEDALHAIVRKRGVEIARYVGVFEIMMILIMLTVGVASSIEPLFQGHDYHQIPGALLSIVVAGYLFSLRRARLRSETDFDDTLLGQLDKTIARIDYQIQRLRTFVWWFIVPGTLGMVLGFIAQWDTKPAWIWPFSVAAMLLAWWTMKRDLSHQLPRKRELESLRATLASEDPPEA